MTFSGKASVKPRKGPVPVVLLAATLFGLWLAWSGHYTPLLVGIGFFSAVGVALLGRAMGIVDSHSIPLHLTHRAVTYIPWLANQTVRSNLGVIRRIFFPRPDDVPETVVTHPFQRTDLGRVTYANSITLTPGTVTVGMDEEKIIVHALTPGTAEGLRANDMNRRVARFEGTPVEGASVEESPGGGEEGRRDDG